MRKNRIAVIGGGASGLIAAVFAAYTPDNEVTVYEGGERVGRKILATGNGRCNLTNVNAGIKNYHGGNADFIFEAKQKFWVQETMDFFESIGLVCKTEDKGRVYPYSDQASAVLDVLRFKLEELNVTVITGFEVSSVSKQDDKFKITAFNGGTAFADKIIVATGGKASPNLGSKGIGYDILKSFGHTVTPLSPSLVQIKTDTEIVKKLKGIKIKALVSMGDREEYDEVLFTEYGLSGPAVFYLSSVLTGNDTLSLDLMPEYTYEKLYDMICTRVYRLPNMTLENFFVGMLNKRVGQAMLKSQNIFPLSRPAVSLSDKEIKSLCTAIKKWTFKIEGTMSWNNAQVTKGGAVTDEFCPLTMESKLEKGLYAVGEVLDIDGDCGGYNLQWAWSSGYLAGISV